MDYLKQNITQLKEVHHKISWIVRIMHQSPTVKEEFCTCQKNLGLPVKTLIQECTTQWNSMFLMLESALKRKDVITLVMAHSSLDEFTLTGK